MVISAVITHLFSYVSDHKEADENDYGEDAGDNADPALARDF